MKKTIFVGIFSGFIVFLSGFTVMFLLWIRIGNPLNLPGFFSYKAATIGDGICLPILVGSMVAFNQKNIIIGTYRRKTRFILALVASLIAVVIQASWLVRDDTVLNWSIPIQHHFNVAGWYHSLFFIAIFSIVAYEMCGMWFVLKERQTEYFWFEKVIYMLFVFAGALFLFMHMVDDYGQNFPVSILLALVAAGLLVMVIIYNITANAIRSRELLPATVMGIISAYSVSLMICMPKEGDIVIALGGGLCACFIWRVHNLSVMKIFVKDIWTIIFYFMALYKISALTNMKELLFALTILTVLTMICEEKSNEEAKSRFISLVVLEAYLLLNKFPIEIKEIDRFANLLFTVAIYFLFNKEIRNYFSEVISAEEKMRINQIRSPEFGEIKGKAYLQITIGILAAALLIFHWIFGLAEKNAIILGVGEWYLPKGLIGIMLMAVGILLIFGTECMRKYKMVKIATLCLCICLFVGMLVCIALNIRILAFMDWPRLKLTMVLFSLCACIGTGILSAHGYYMNMVWLRGMKGKKLIAIMALAQGIGGAFVSFAITVLILCRQTWKVLILIGVFTVCVFIIIPLLHARVFQYGYEVSHVIGNKPLGGIAQDGLMICLIVFFIICMPCLYISLSTKGVEAWLEAVMLVCTAFPPVSYCLNNNVEHIKRQKKVLAKYPEEKKLWDTLHECLVRQSWQTVFATFPYVCIAAIATYGNRMMKSMDRKQIWKDIYNTYIDAEDYD